MARVVKGIYSETALKRFRIHAAAVVRYLIRARAKHEPHFLPASVYAEWDLVDFDKEDRNTVELLRMAETKIRQINAWYLDRDPSGGFRMDPDDPLWDLKMLVGSFVDQRHALSTAIGEAQKGLPVDWGKLANWDDISKIRELLNQLPHPWKQEGPDPSGRVRWGTSVQSLQKMPLALLNVLWGREKVPYEKAVRSVWTVRKQPSRKTVSQTLLRINKCLLKLQVPWQYHLRGDSIIAEHAPNADSP